MNMNKDKVGKLYHVTFGLIAPFIQTGGIEPQKDGTWTKRDGSEIRECGLIYAFSDREHAVRWAFKQDYDCPKAKMGGVAILSFKRRGEWEKDSNVLMDHLYPSALQMNGGVAPSLIDKHIILETEWRKEVKPLSYSEGRS